MTPAVVGRWQLCVQQVLHVHDVSCPATLRPLQRCRASSRRTMLYGHIFLFSFIFSLSKERTQMPAPSPLNMPLLCSMCRTCCRPEAYLAGGGLAFGSFLLKVKKMNEKRQINHKRKRHLPGLGQNVSAIGPPRPPFSHF